MRVLIVLYCCRWFFIRVCDPEPGGEGTGGAGGVAETVPAPQVPQPGQEPTQGHRRSHISTLPFNF